MTKLKGFKTRRWTTAKGKTKECYYYQQHRDAGGLIPLGSDYKQAIKRYADLIGIPVEDPEPNTVAAAYAEYVQWATNRQISKLSPRTIADRTKYWEKHLGKAFGHCDIDALESPWMLEYFEMRSSQVSAKKELKFLQTLCNWSRARGLMRGPDPFAGIMRLMEVDEKCDIYVTDTWFNLVYKHGTQFVKDTMDFALLFATRPAETESAMFRHIEDDELVVELQKTRRKGLKEKRVPVTRERLAYINRQRARTPRSFYLVSDEKGQALRTIGGKFRKEWDEARDKAEEEAAREGISFERFALRDIRAKAATDIARQHGIEAARLI